MNKAIDIASLHRLFDYDADKGSMILRARTAEDFVSGKQSAEHNCAIWNGRFAGSDVSGPGPRYARATVGSDRLYVHHIAWALHHGQWPSQQIDHIDGDKRNNRIANLREVSPVENCRNSPKRKNNISGHVGVSWRPRRSRWEAFISVDRKFISLGSFERLAEAIAARKLAELQIGFHPNHGRSRPATHTAQVQA